MLGGSLKGIERDAIINALHQTHGQQHEAAELLAISPRKLYYKMRAMAIPNHGARRGAHPLQA